MKKYQVIIEARMFYRVELSAANEVEAERIAELNTEWANSEPIHRTADIYQIIEQPEVQDERDDGV